MRRPPDPAALRDTAARLPRRPGVYLFRDATGEILYVGKAQDLRSRVRSYLQTASALEPKTRVLMVHAAAVDYLVTTSVIEALLLEANLIKEHNPRYNIQLRDDKSYPYIKVTLQEDYPRVYVTRRVVADGARYFGPYTQVKLLRRNLALIRDVFTVRSCRYRLLDERPARPCLDYHIHRCDAPCVEYLSREAYREMIGEVVAFLEGDTRAAGRALNARMARAAERLDFERAAGYQRQLAALEEMATGQRVSSLGGEDRDVVALARDGDEACGLILRIRDGRLLGTEHHLLGNVAGETEGAALSLFLTRYYLRGDAFPREVLVSSDFEDRGLLEAVLGDRAGHRVRLRAPRRGDAAAQVRLAVRNARYHLEERRLTAERQTERAVEAVVELRAALGLGRDPRRIACVDISTIQGRDSVGSIVTFENGRPRKAGYRRFRIRTVEAQDDYAMLAEVVDRYLRGLLDHDEVLPDLLVVDGGRGQLSAVRAVLEELGVGGALDIVSLAKREEELFLPDTAEPVRLPRRSPALQLV
ncbi:MAG: excinuclease ABC subunit UvrC, partial [Gemmatimonadota bacterium]